MQGFVDVFQYANSYTFNANTSRTNIKIYNQSLLLSVGYSLGKKIK